MQLLHHSVLKIEGARHACYMEKTREFHKGLIEFLSTLKWGMGPGKRRRERIKKIKRMRQIDEGATLVLVYGSPWLDGINSVTHDDILHKWNSIAFNRVLQMFLLNYSLCSFIQSKGTPVWEQRLARIFICILAFFYVVTSLHEKGLARCYCTVFFFLTGHLKLTVNINATNFILLHIWLVYIHKY